MTKRTPTEIRLAMLAGGYDPLATNGKTPVEESWPDKTGRSADEIKDLAKRFPFANGTGFNNRRVLGIDVDITDPYAADTVYSAIEDWFGARGKILRRFGNMSKFMVPLRIDVPMPKIVRQWKAANGATHQIEARGDGQQCMADGFNPDARRDYWWANNQDLTNTPRAELPPTDEKEICELLDYLGDLLAEQFDWVPCEAKAPAGNGHDKSDRHDDGAPFDPDAALATMAPNSASVEETQRRVILSWLQRGEHPQDILDRIVDKTLTVANQAALRWSRVVEINCVTNRICKQFKTAAKEHIDARTLPPWLPGEFHKSWLRIIGEGHRPLLVPGPHGWVLRISGRRRDGAPGTLSAAMTDGAAAMTKGGDAGEQSSGQSAGHSQSSRPGGADGKEAEPTWPTPYSGRAAPQIPRRSFAMGQHYIIGATSITASAGGVGKSTLSLLDGVSFIVGRNLLTGETLEKRRRVWIWNAEDDIDEMERRLTGICIHYGINRADLVDWLFLDSGYDLPLDLAHGNSKGPVMQDQLIGLIAERVTRRNIEIVILDPLVALHSMSEGDNPGHAKLIRTLSTKVAKPCSCAIDIDAHTRKPGVGQDTLTVDDVRGAGSIIYSARSGRILHTMSLAEAEKYGIDPEERLTYYRLERGKANMAKRGTICWVHMIEVPIPNSPDGSYGDTIAVPTLWTPPDAMAGITDTVAEAIAREIAKGDYKRDARAGASWAGRLVGLRCGIDVGTKSGRARANVVLETLIKKGVLAIEIRTDKNRNAREYVVPGTLFNMGKR